jgi:hypothetical protein
MITNIKEIRHSHAVYIEVNTIFSLNNKKAALDAHENKENMVCDINAQDSCKNFNIMKIEREFGTDLMNVIKNEATVCMPSDSKIYSCLNKRQVELKFLFI